VTDAVSPVFKQIINPAHIELATTQMLKTWFPTYIREVEKQLGLPVGVIKAPLNYTNRNSFDALPGELIPKCVVISPGLAEVPTMDGEGWYTADWQLGVGVATAGPTEDNAVDHVKIYGAAARVCVMQQLAANVDFIGNVRWVGETYDDLPITDQIQQYRAAQVFFVVSCDGVMNSRSGPDVPDHEPYEYGKAQHVITQVDLIKEDIDQ